MRYWRSLNCSLARFGLRDGFVAIDCLFEIKWIS